MSARHELIEGAHGLLTIIVILIASVLLFLGRMTTDQWVDLTKWIVGIFAGTHAVLHVAKRKAAARAPDPDGLPAATSLSDRMAP